MLNARLVQVSAAVPMVLAIMVSSVFGQDAQPEGLVDGRIVGRVWHTKVPFSESFQYLQKLREELGISAVYSKPFSPSAIVKACGELLRLSTQSPECV